MKAVLWFRAASVLLLLFAAGHTYGFLSFHPTTAEGLAVWEGMQNVHLTAAKNTPFTYGGFYTGFGLFISAFGLFTAWLAWTLGGMAGRGMPEARSLAWAMIALECLSFVLAIRYFSAGPALLSAMTAVCLVMGAIRMRLSPNVSV